MTPTVGVPLRVVCARGHHTTRGGHADLVAQPRCAELLESGFCLAPAWQDPASVRTGDIVVVLDAMPLGERSPGRRIVRAIVEGWTRDPDRPAALIDEFGMERTVLLDSWYTPNQPGPVPLRSDRTPSGRPAPVLISFPEASSMLPQLIEIAADVRKRRREAKVQMVLARENAALLEKDKPTTRGAPAPWDIPWNLFDEANDCHESGALEYYREARLAWRRQMTWMFWHHRSYWKILHMNVHEARGPADIAALIAISKPNARVRLHRARTLMHERLELDAGLPSVAQS